MRINDKPALPRLLTIRQVAEQLCCSPATVYAIVEAGQIPVVRVGKSKGYRVDQQDLETFICERKFSFRIAPASSPKTKLKHIKL